MGSDAISVAALSFDLNILYFKTVRDTRGPSLVSVIVCTLQRPMHAVAGAVPEPEEDS